VGLVLVAFLSGSGLVSIWSRLGLGLVMIEWLGWLRSEVMNVVVVGVGRDRYGSVVDGLVLGFVCTRCEVMLGWVVKRGDR
jgi:hypothetical protein